MIIRNIVGFNLNSNMQIKNVSFRNNETTDSKNLVKDNNKEKEIKNEVKKIFNKGVITGGALVTGLIIFDYLGDYLANKLFGETPKLNDNFHIPFKWILGKIKK